MVFSMTFVQATKIASLAPRAVCISVVHCALMFLCVVWFLCGKGPGDMCFFVIKAAVSCSMARLSFCVGKMPIAGNRHLSMLLSMQRSFCFGLFTTLYCCTWAQDNAYLRYLNNLESATLSTIVVVH